MSHFYNLKQINLKEQKIKYYLGSTRKSNIYDQNKHKILLNEQQKFVYQFLFEPW